MIWMIVLEAWFRAIGFKYGLPRAFRIFQENLTSRARSLANTKSFLNVGVGIDCFTPVLTVFSRSYAHLWLIAHSRVSPFSPIFLKSKITSACVYDQENTVYRMQTLAWYPIQLHYSIVIPCIMAESKSLNDFVIDRIHKLGNFYKPLYKVSLPSLHQKTPFPCIEMRRIKSDHHPHRRNTQNREHTPGVVLTRTSDWYW